MESERQHFPDTAVILVGGLGTRLSEETVKVPKPLVEVGEKPILWHIMKIYNHYGIKKFILCAGYKQQSIKEYFNNFFLHESDVEFDTSSGTVEVLRSSKYDWKVSVINTGLNSQTGERLRKVARYLPDEFFLTYGDGVADVDMNELYESHARSGKIATVTAVQPSGRFGALDISEGSVVGFVEKPKGDGNWVNGGFFVFKKECLNYIQDGNVTLEDGMLGPLADGRALNAYLHDGFWQPMDTIRDKDHLNKLWDSNTCPWRKWHD